MHECLCVYMFICLEEGVIIIIVSMVVVLCCDIIEYDLSTSAI